MRPLRVGVWCAVSSTPQAADDRESLPAQEEAGRRFAESIGGTVTATYRVNGHSREYVFWAEAEAEMPAYRHAREDIESARVDVIHCTDASRLGRDPALISQFYSLAAKHGAEVYDASMPHPLGQQSMGHRYGIAVKSVSAGEEQRIRVARHKTGMKGRIRRRGLHPNNWPMGYTPIRSGTGETVGAEFNDDIGTVERITALFLDGISYTEIARRLTADGHLTPRRVDYWHPSTVRNIILNDTYAGLLSAFGVALDAPSPAFPALWDGTTFAAVVRERARRGQKPYVRKSGGPYTGVAKCKRCGGAMTRCRTRQFWYLRCSTHTHSKTTGESCHWNHMPEWRITRVLHHWLKEYTTPERVDEALAEMGTGQEERALRESLARSTATVDSLAKQRERLALALARGEMDGDIYRQADDKLLRQLDAERGRGVDLRRQIDALPDLEERRRTLEQLHRRFYDWVEKDDPATIAKLLQSAGVVVWCEDGNVVGVEWD